jgi:hypothetical protein
MERDTKFVEWGAIYARCGRDSTGGWENLKSFDDFPERRFPGLRRKAYYLMSIHEKPATAGEEGVEKGRLGGGARVGEAGAPGLAELRLCNLVA